MGGRPALSADQKKQTTQTRVSKARAEKLAWIIYFATGDAPKSSADYIDAHLGARIDADYERVRKQAEQVKRLRAREAAIRGEEG